MKEYEESHQKGVVLIEQELKKGVIIADLGIQIAEDGRVWLCVNGKALIRFTPLNEKDFKLYEEIYG